MVETTTDFEGTTGVDEATPIATTQKKTSAVARSSRSVKLGKCPTPWQLWHIIRRLGGIVAAIVYIHTLTWSGIWSLRTISGVVLPSFNLEINDVKLILKFAGTGPMSKSPLVRDVLAGNTTPRQNTLYLNSDVDVSSQGCSAVPHLGEWVYMNDFMRSNWDELVKQTSYNATVLKQVELIAPVVDCTFKPIVMGDDTISRVYYLVRSKADPNDVMIIILSMTTQDYSLPERYQVGSAGYVTLIVVRDMSVPLTYADYFTILALEYPYEGPEYVVYEYAGLTREGKLILDSIPSNPSDTHRMRVTTIKRTGFYINSESSRANMQNLHWEIFLDPYLALSRWEWLGFTYCFNVWGWTRIIYLAFALQTVFSIFVLTLVAYHNLRRGKIWIGDAFVSISHTLMFQGLGAFLVWAIEGFWRPFMMAVSDGSALGGGIGVSMVTEVVHGDLIILYVALAGVLGAILRERIDPGLVVLLFELSFHYRFQIARWFPKTHDIVVEYATNDYYRGRVAIPPEYQDVSPFGFWTTHPVSRDLDAFFSNLFPVFVSFAVLLVYVPVRKLYRRVYPPPMLGYSSRMTTGNSVQGDTSAIKSVFTMFEIATGAELQNRVGVVADYDNCVYVKGTRYATPDGIYCNGFVIANGKWLIRTENLLSILMIIVTRVRLRDVYVYEFKDHKISQTARLVYPDTVSLKDLFFLNITVLS
ncbi:hypothetical protein Poli38472_004235 [Pythium oligandrum]|uniref:Transmembrane protein n=1 Tax=Pythium oligandrum TaxID=41045 RepID=A0A8K1CPR2_PYTOL|nr:hypothetical protein Poli38472_004235 [Pythium oligandrum]|eukprot:TMW66470.1 hypothetical protein Poli38472_004235 [Pythium oligandrum]